MKITDVKVYPVVPDTSLAVSSGSQVGWVFVVVETDEGIAGFGESSNWPRKGNILVSRAHVAKTIPNFYKLEIFSLWLCAFNKTIKTPIDVREGSLYLSDKPGLGVELDMNWIETHRDPDWT